MNPRELATVLAALRRHQSVMVSGKTTAFDDIASDGGSFKALSAQEIDGLCERLNMPEQSTKAKPLVAIVMDGGVIQDVIVDRDARCAQIDYSEVGSNSRAVPQGDGTTALASCEPLFPLVDPERAAQLVALSSPLAKAMSQGRSH